MTKEEKLIVSAYTGILMVDVGEFLEYTEKLLDRPVLAKEIYTEEFANAVVNAAKEDFDKLCED